MLCQACAQIFDGHRELGSIQHHSSALELQKACEIGCRMCGLLWRSFSTYTSEGVSQETTSMAYRIESAKKSVIGYQVDTADLYLLTLYINTEFVTSLNDRDRYRTFFVEPFKGWSRLQR